MNSVWENPGKTVRHWLVSSGTLRPRCVGEGPHAGEVFSLVRVGETDRVAIKTAYGRYVSVAISGDLAGRTEAMGPREQWELVFEEVSEQPCGALSRILLDYL